MATKKNSSSNGKRSAATTSRKPAAKKSSNSQPSAAAQQAILSNDLIGQTAGEVWHQLADSQGQSLTALKKSIDAPGELVLAALGWLAREGKLSFASSGRSVKVSLREQADSLAHADA